MSSATPSLTKLLHIDSNSDSSMTKDEAYHEAKMKRKKADFARKHAEKQFQYTPDTHYFKQRMNEAWYHEKEARKAKDKYKKM